MKDNFRSCKLILIYLLSIFQLTCPSTFASYENPCYFDYSLLGTIRFREESPGLWVVNGAKETSHEIRAARTIIEMEGSSVYLIGNYPGFRGIPGFDGVMVTPDGIVSNLSLKTINIDTPPRPIKVTDPLILAINEVEMASGRKAFARSLGLEFSEANGISVRQPNHLRSTHKGFDPARELQNIWSLLGVKGNGIIDRPTTVAIEFPNVPPHTFQFGRAKADRSHVVKGEPVLEISGTEECISLAYLQGRLNKDPRIKKMIIITPDSYLEITPTNYSIRPRVPRSPAIPVSPSLLKSEIKPP